jgi:arylsulfatase A-like enzyme
MIRRCVFVAGLFFGLGVIGGVSAAAFGAGDTAAKRPNIIFVLADDLGYGDVACYNPESKVPTPCLDRLAQEGVRFTDAHAASNVCTPSRYSVLTGQMDFRINFPGVFTGVGGPCLIKENQLTLPQMLRNRGYATAMTGKWHIGLTFLDKDGKPIVAREGMGIEGLAVEGVKQIDYSRPIPDAPIHRGFDRFFGTAGCPGTDWLYAFIVGDRIPVQPTKLIDKTHLPKHPYSVDNRDGMIAPDYDLEELDLIFLKKSQEFIEEQVRNHPDQPFFLHHCTAAVHLPSFAARELKGNTKAGPHGDYIFEFDYVVGELMKTLDHLGIADNTIIMVSSDNGPETLTVMNMRAGCLHDGAHPWRGFKRDNWEGGHRVPLIVRWPAKIAPGSTTDQTVCLTDVMATCADITGAMIPDDAAQDSYSFLPVLLGKDADAAIRPYTLHQSMVLGLAIRKGPWKFIDQKGSDSNDYKHGPLAVVPECNNAPTAPGQLYNLKTDPGETNNLYFEHPEIVRELKAQLEKSKAAGRSRPPALPKE